MGREDELEKILLLAEKGIQSTLHSARMTEKHKIAHIVYHLQRRPYLISVITGIISQQRDDTLHQVVNTDSISMKALELRLNQEVHLNTDTITDNEYMTLLLLFQRVGSPRHNSWANACIKAVQFISKDRYND